MFIRIVFLFVGAAMIALLGRWSQQSRVTVVVLCCVWGCLIANLHD